MAAILALSSFGSGKKYLSDRVDTYSHVSVPYVKGRLIFNSVMHSLLALKRTLEKAVEVEDEDLEAEIFRKLYNPWIVQVTLESCFNVEPEKSGSSLDFDPWKGVVGSIFYQSVVDFMNMQTLRWYEQIAFNNLSARATDKLIKDVSQSALRKAARAGRFSAASYIFQTSMKSKLLLCSAGFTVEQVLTLYYWDPTKPFSLQTYVLVTLPKMLIKRVGVRLICMSAGAAIGTAIKPGSGTTYVMLLTDFAISPIAQAQVDAILG